MKKSRSQSNSTFSNTVKKKGGKKKTGGLRRRKGELSMIDETAAPSDSGDDDFKQGYY